MDASVIVPVWNGTSYLPSCLDALLAQQGLAFEVIAVDDASSDGSPELVAQHYPQIRLIRNRDNLGFVRSCNVGLTDAQGDVLVLLNQDTVVRPGWLAALLAVLREFPEAGIAGGKALYPDGTIQHAGGAVDRQGSGSHLGYGQTDDGRYDQRREVDYVTGANLAITRAAFQHIGGLDEGFHPAYYEDVDWCYRARQSGFRVLYVPEAVLVHYEDSSLADDSHAGMYLFHRNRLRFVLKHWPQGRLTGEFLPAERDWLLSLGEGAERLVAAVHHGYLYQLLHLADLLDWRRRLLDATMDEADVLAGVLTELRTVVPLRPARIFPSHAPVADARVDARRPAAQPDGQATDLLAGLRLKGILQEHEFHSRLPILGPAIAGFRRFWYSIAAQWAIRALAQQQSQFNAELVQVLGQYQAGLVQYQVDRQRLGEVLAEYLAENGREQAEMAVALEKLQARLPLDAGPLPDQTTGPTR